VWTASSSKKDTLTGEGPRRGGTVRAIEQGQSMKYTGRKIRPKRAKPAQKDSLRRANKKRTAKRVWSDHRRRRWKIKKNEGRVGGLLKVCVDRGNVYVFGESNSKNYDCEVKTNAVLI